MIDGRLVEVFLGAAVALAVVAAWDYMGYGPNTNDLMIGSAINLALYFWIKSKAPAP